jgi:transcriptional regulator with XRE-family HTH domain
MELIGDRIQRLIKEKGYAKPILFYKKLKELYGARAFARFTLTRILKNKVNVRETTLQQIATTLLVKTSDIRKGTNVENIEEIPDEKKYSYSGGSELQILEKNLPFVVKELTLRNISYRFTEDEFIPNDLGLDPENATKFPATALLDEMKKAGVKIPSREKVRDAVYKLNYILRTENLKNKLKSTTLPAEAAHLMERKKLLKIELIQLNRLILEAAFPKLCPIIPKNRLCTDIEQDDPKAVESLKWIFVMKGRVNVVINPGSAETKQTLPEGQRFSFDARQPHYFENLSKKISRILIIHYPASNNIFTGHKP